MGRNLVHILNGDGTWAVFQKANIPSNDHIIWREGMALGPTEMQLLTQESMARRKLFWETYSDIEENLPDYYQYVLPELIKVLDLKESTVFCWFEFDLFCQINMLFAVDAINQELGNHIFLISADKVEGVDDFKGYGQLNPQQLTSVFESSAVNLKQSDLEFIHKALQRYNRKEPFELEQFLDLPFPESLTNLKPALHAHLARFPSTFNGLGAPEQELLLRINDQDMTKKQLIRQSLLDDRLLGFGDLEFFRMLNNLTEYVDSSSQKLKLNKQGKQLVSGEIDYWESPRLPKWLGGSMISNKDNRIRWDSAQSRLIRINE